MNTGPRPTSASRLRVCAALLVRRAPPSALANSRSRPPRMQMVQKSWFSHSRNFGKGSRRCRVCNAHQGLIRRYGLIICRRCFRDHADKIGFFKYR